MVGGDAGEDFPVQDDAVLLEGADELAVGRAVLAERGVQAHVPETAEVVLLVAPVRERVLAGVHDCLARLALLCRAAEPVALRLGEDVPAALQRCFSSFDACHRLAVREKAAPALRAHVERRRTRFVELARARLFRVEMVLARLPGNDLARARDAETLRV